MQPFVNFFFIVFLMLQSFNLRGNFFQSFYEWMESQEKRKNVNFYFLRDTFFSFSFVSFLLLWLSIKKRLEACVQWAFLFSNPWRRKRKKTNRRRRAKTSREKHFPKPLFMQIRISAFCRRPRKFDGNSMKVNWVRKIFFPYL